MNKRAFLSDFKRVAKGQYRKTLAIDFKDVLEALVNASISREIS